MPLEEYQRKRQFNRTPEPTGETEPDKGPGQQSTEELRFVVQKHAATRLHYDFRLELDGVLKSWAVPKGPSLDPHDKRLAVHVEDHPLDYGGFEGVIPPGEYGAGTVMVWDRGTYTPKEDVSAGYAKGSLKVELHGEKLAGGFALVRMKSRPGDHGDNWLLIKERDEHVRTHEEYDVTEARPDSVASGRDLEQIAAEERPAESAPGASGGGPVPFGEGGPAVRGPLPSDAPVQLATLVDRAPSDAGWIHEIKYDGYRIRCALDKGRALLATRAGQNWTDRFAPIVSAIEALPARSALLDGEIVAMGSNGVSNFGLLQQALSDAIPSRLTYMIFDLLYLDGWDLRQVPLRRRKELLAALLPPPGTAGPVRYVDHVEGDGAAFHQQACTLALEGSVSKRADRSYIPGRTRDWLKVRCHSRQEFVVVGWTEPRGSRIGFGALLLAVASPSGELRYAGKVGTGFSDSDLARIRRKLEAIATDDPVAVAPRDARTGVVHWVRPELVAEVSFREWTREGLLRHASFLGVRADKSAREVVREQPGETGGGSLTRAGRTSITVAGVTLTSPDKVLFAGRGDDPGVTKADLAHYYERIATHIVAQAADRPLTLVRCPHGHERDCFYQKHPEKKGFPPQIRTLQIRERNGTGVYIYLDSPAGVVALAQLGTLEIHAWNSRVASPETPDRIVLDLDPGADVGWSVLRTSALRVRDVLAALGLTAFLKTTGGKGLHLVVPILPEYGYDSVRALARAFVGRLASSEPRTFTARMAIASRPGRVFIDYLRNAHGATAIVAFSTRARPGAPVAVPLAWEELTEGLDTTTFDVRTVPARLKSLRRDPWEGYENARVRLEPALWEALGAESPG